MSRVPDFDAVYRADPDPWQVQSSFYEGRKLALLLAVLSRPRYAFAWDPGCGVGELAARLGERADRVLATDASEEAISLTRRRCADQPSIAVDQVRLPDPPPARGFDLVVLSEFWFYLDPADRLASITLIDGCAAPAAEVVSVHWRPEPHDGFLSGQDVQAEIGTQLGNLGWVSTTHHDDRDFVLDVHRHGV